MTQHYASIVLPTLKSQALVLHSYGFKGSQQQLGQDLALSSLALLLRFLQVSVIDTSVPVRLILSPPTAGALCFLFPLDIVRISQ